MDSDRPDRRPAFALAVVVGASFVTFALLSTLVSVPRVFPDEVRYMIGASSVVEGEGLSLRGEEYGFGALHAAVLTLVLWLSSGLESAYPWFKVANALFWALTAIPVYLLARRLVSAWWAVLAASLAVAIPSSISVGTVMTESMAYLAAAWALYATLLALERPTVGRQLVLLAAIAVAFLTRSQLGVLYVGWLVALALHWWIHPSARPRARRELVRYWPSVLPLLVAGLGLGARLASGSTPRDALGAYWELWRGYDSLAVAKWVVYHVADIEIYLAVVPLAVAPIVLTRLVRSGRAGSALDSALASLFLAANATGLVVVAAFTSTPWGYDRLHDRYAFYLMPLWLLVFAIWLADGLPRPLVATASGAGLALVLPAILPFGQLANEAGIDTVPGALWVWIQDQSGGYGRRLLGVFVLALLLAALLLPRRLRLVFPAAVLAVFLATSALAWQRLVDAPEDAVFAGGLERAWIDAAVPEDARVTKVYLDTACGSALERHALFLSEAFNATVDRAAYVGDSTPDGLPIERVDVGPGGRLLLSPGNPLVAEYVVTQRGLELEGERIATGTNAGLALWRVGGPVSVAGAKSNDELAAAVCA